MMLINIHISKHQFLLHETLERQIELKHELPCTINNWICNDPRAIDEWNLAILMKGVYLHKQFLITHIQIVSMKKTQISVQNSALKTWSDLLKLLN